MVKREAPAPKRVFKREGRLEINPLLIQAFGITPEEIGDVIKSAEEPEAMRDMFAFLSDYATLSDPGTRLSISGDKLDFLVADMRRRMARVADFYEYHAKTSGDLEEEERLLKFANKAKRLSLPVGDTRTDKIAYIDAVMGFQHTSGLILPLAFRITDYGREDYWPRKLLVFLRSHGMPGMVREGSAPNNSQPEINWNLNVREGRIVYMPPEEYMERVNIFNRIGISKAVEDERKAIGKGYRGIGYYPPLSEQSYRSILEGIRAGNEIDIPNLVYRNGMVENQEGFHRALVARDIGIEKIPVQVIGEMPSGFSRALNLRWNENLIEQVKAINALKGKVIGGVSMIREATTPVPEQANNGFRANPGLINKQAAYAAHRGTSFEPEKRGEQAIRGFAEGVQAVYERLKPHARTDAEKALLVSEMERFQASYAQKYNDLLYSHSRIYSTMIAGPSGFPTERMRKINEAYDNKSRETYEWKDRAERAMLKTLKGLAIEEAGGEVAVLKAKIVQAEKLQEMMVEANKIVRKKPEPGIGGVSKHQQLINLGFTERQVVEALTPDYMGRLGFPSFALTNNSANIRRMKERLIELGKREVTPTAEIPFTGGHIVDNREEDRVQIFFDQKPPQEMIDKLKGEGWRWAPSVGAWSRKRTDAALYSARRITGAALPPAPVIQPPAVPPPPVPAPQPQAVPERGKLDNVIALMEQYVRDGKTYEDFVAGLKGYYLPQSGYQINNHLDVERLSADRKEAGYNTLTELWNDTSRKLRMRMYVPPKPTRMLYPAPEVTPPRPAEEIMIVPNPETMTRDEYIKEKFRRLAQVLRQQGKPHIAARAEMGTDPEYISKFAASHRDQVVLALAQNKAVTPAVLKDYPDIVGRIRKENEEILAKIRAERERIKAIERIEETELNAELNRLPPALKRHAETEIYGTLHLPETHKDYRNRYYIALGKVRRIAFEFAGGKEPLPPVQPQVLLLPLPYPEVRKEEPVEPLSPEYERVLKAYLEKRGYELTLRDFIWADKYTIRGTAKYAIRTMEEKRMREEFILKNYDIETGKKFHRGTVISALERGIKVPDEVLKDYPDLMKKEVPEPTPTVPAAVKPVQSIQDIKQQVIQSIQEAKSMVELKQILKGLGFLPLPEPEKRQLMGLYQNRFSELMGELKFGERIPEEEMRKKRRAPQKAPYAPPSRRLEEYGIKEAIIRRYGYA
uniref:Putative methyltransferase n=1 Tax=viral metagenome TaxID=1070528 RepID=A0A6M3XFV3_9ZZZZ